MAEIITGEELIQLMGKNPAVATALQFELALHAARKTAAETGTQVVYAGVHRKIFDELLHQLALFCEMKAGNREALYRCWGSLRFAMYEMNAKMAAEMPDMEFFMFMDDRFQVIYSV